MINREGAERAALEIDLRLGKLWDWWKDEEMTAQEKKDLIDFLRLAYYIGYSHALEDGGKLFEDTNGFLTGWKR